MANVGSVVSFRGNFAYDSQFKIEADFEVRAPITALVGPSGCGKTTLLKLIAGLLRLDSGLVRFDQNTWVDTAGRIFLSAERRRVGLLMQSPFLFPHLTIRHNVWYGARRRRSGTELVMRIVEVCEIGELLDRRPHQLSGGQAQRVALARALASNPQLLLLDEPLASIEASLQSRIAEFMKRISREFQVPMIFVSHQADLVSQLTDHRLIMESGTVRSEVTR